MCASVCALGGQQACQPTARTIFRFPHVELAVPPAAVPAEIPRRVPIRILLPCTERPDGDGWLHEVKHDGHLLVVIVDGAGLRLMSRNGYDRTELFAEPFRALSAAERPPLVLDGEIAVPDENGITHI